MKRKEQSKPGFWAKLFGKKAKQEPAPERKPADPPAGPSKEVSESKKLPSLSEIVRQNSVTCNGTVAQQQIWLTQLSKAISTIMVGGGPMCADYYLTPQMLEEAGDMNEVLARTGFVVGKLLSMTDLERAVKTDSVLALVRAYCILDAYAGMMRPPYCDPIRNAAAYVYSVLEKADLSKVAGERNRELFWAPVVLPGDTQQVSAPDYVIHIFPEAEKMLNEGSELPAADIILGAYEMAPYASGNIVQLQIQSMHDDESGLETIPLFTDLNVLFAVYSQNVRVGLVDYPMARLISLANRNACAGISINPGGEDRFIPNDQLAAEDEYYNIYVHHRPE